MDLKKILLIKLNFDGFVLASNVAAAGFVLRNEDGNVILASSSWIGHLNVMRAEAFALRAGLHASILHGHGKLIIE